MKRPGLIARLYRWRVRKAAVQSWQQQKYLQQLEFENVMLSGNLGSWKRCYEDKKKEVRDLEELIRQLRAKCAEQGRELKSIRRHRRSLPLP